MAQKKISPDAAAARELLDALWTSILGDTQQTTDSDIDRLIDSRSVSIRYCLPTQLLGKAVDPKLDCLCLQKGDGTLESQWDPRGFATKVTVPWVMANQNVLGTSADPYVSLPLRRPRLEPEPGSTKARDEWKLLYQILKEVEDRSDAEFTLTRLRSVLASVARKLAESSFEYVVPERISLEQTRTVVNAFLSEPSGGDRGLSVAAALFQVFGHYFGLYSEVRRAVINASDTSTGLTADIECIDAEGNLRLAIEVKERGLTLTDVKGAIRKARRASIQEFLFNAPSVSAADATQIDEQFARTWASGTNLYHLTVDELIKVGLSLTGEEGRKEFIENVGRQLNEFNTQPINRQRWKALLDDI